MSLNTKLQYSVVYRADTLTEKIQVLISFLTHNLNFIYVSYYKNKKNKITVHYSRKAQL